MPSDSSPPWQRSPELIGATNDLLHPLQDQLPEVSKAPLPDVVFHYTDTAGLLGIIERGGFWATDYRYMNDSAEIQYVFRLASDVAKTRLQTDSKLNPYSRAFLERAATGIHP
jgi:hypothetical protein